MAQRMSHGKAEKIDSMNQALQRECAALRKLLARAAAGEVDARYAAGVRIVKIQAGDDTYGERAVDRAASALGQKPRTLYRYGTVARTWSRSEMAALRRQRNCHGLPLVWSHWVELAPQKDWKVWLGRTLKEGWRVRRLSKELESARDKTYAETADAEESTRMAILEANRNVTRLNAQVGSLRQLLERLLQSPDRSPRVEEPLVRFRALITEVGRRTTELAIGFNQLPPPKGPTPPGGRSGARRPGPLLLSGATSASGATPELS